MKFRDSAKDAKILYSQYNGYSRIKRKGPPFRRGIAEARYRPEHVRLIATKPNQGRAIMHLKSTQRRIDQYIRLKTHMI